MRPKHKNLGPKTPDQVEALLEQAAGFEPESEAPDDLVARAMANLPAARASGRKQALAYGACGAAAIAGMGYLTAVTIARGGAETADSMPKGTLHQGNLTDGGPSLERGSKDGNAGPSAAHMVSNDTREANDARMKAEPLAHVQRS